MSHTLSTDTRRCWAVETCHSSTELTCSGCFCFLPLNGEAGMKSSVSSSSWKQASIGHTHTRVHWGNQRFRTSVGGGACALGQTLKWLTVCVSGVCLCVSVCVLVCFGGSPASDWTQNSPQTDAGGGLSVMVHLLGQRSETCYCMCEALTCLKGPVQSFIYVFIWRCPQLFPPIRVIM